MRIRSVRNLLVAVVTALVLLIVVFQVVFFPTQQDDASKEALRGKAIAIAELVANNVSGPLEFNDAAAVTEVFDGVAKDGDLAYLGLYRTDGALFVAHAQERLPKLAGARPSATESALTGSILEVRTPVAIKGGDGGLLVAGFSTDRIEAERLRNLQVAFGAGLLVFALGAGTSVFLGNWVGRRIETIADVAAEVASGRLDLPPLEIGADDEIGRTARSFNTMVANLRQLRDQQRELVKQIASTAAELNAAAAQVLSSSRSQERGANDQAAVVEETKRTMDGLLDAAARVGEVSEGVRRDAEATHGHIELIAERIRLLSSHVQRIGEVLEVIKDIANKTDLLALNAALEGTRAGEAGRGFSQVATRMQRLTENVMGAVRDIKGLTTDIRSATNAAVLATEEAIKRSASSAESARHIQLTTEQQRSGTQQVGQSMDDISTVIRQAVAASSDLAATATAMAAVADRLQAQVRTFELPT